jgi:hypothetical protein
MRIFAVATIIVLVTSAFLWPVMRCDFVNIDDPQTVSQNPLLTPPSVHGLIHIWTHAAMGLYVPVTYTVWSIIAFFCPEPLLPNEPMQLDPALFHGANLLLHVMSALVVWAILRRCLKAHKKVEIAACLGAILFALHPLQVEPVAWVSGLKDVLSGLMVFVAIWQYFGFVDSAPKSLERKVRYLIVLIAAGLAMLSKPSAMVLPALLIILDFGLLRRSMPDIARGVVPVILICLPCTVMAMVIQHPPRNVALWQRPIVVLDSISFYTRKLFWPVNLAPDYGRRPTDALAYRFIWLCWVIPLLIAIVLWPVRRRAPLVVLGVVLFVCAVLPTLGFVNTLFQDKSTVADHYLYVGMLGLALAFAAIVERIWSKPIIALAAIILGACGFFSFRQTAFWRDSMSSFAHTAEVSPRSWSGRLGLASELAKQKQFPQAEQRVREAIDIYPSSRTYLALGQVMVIANQPADAIEPLQKALELEPGIENGELTLAAAYLGVGQPHEAVRVLENYQQAHPDDERAATMLKQAQSASP